MADMHFIRKGTGKPLLLIHGIGGTHRSWDPIIPALALHREVIAVDLPGHGATPPLRERSMRTLADAITDFLTLHGLTGIDAVGSSMGARLVLELVRRGGVLGAVLSLDPGGFWRGWERHAFFTSIALSIRLVRGIKGLLPAILRTVAGRIALLSQLSACPAKLAPGTVITEVRGYATTPSFDELLRDVAYGEEQKGMKQGSLGSPLVIGWGRKDRVCFPSQAKRAMKLFPDARLQWFRNCGHFPHWDRPEATVALILKTTE